MRTAIIYVIAVLAYVASTLALYNQPIIETRLPLAACPNADSCLPLERPIVLSSPKGPLILALVGQDIATYNSQAFPTGWAMLALQLDQTNSSLLASAVLYSNSTESLQCDNSEYITKGSIVEQENNSAVILITCSANSTIDTKQILLQATLSFNAEQELDGILWTSLNTNSVLPFTFPVSTDKNLRLLDRNFNGCGNDVFIYGEQGMIGISPSGEMAYVAFPETILQMKLRCDVIYAIGRWNETHFKLMTLNVARSTNGLISSFEEIVDKELIPAELDPHLALSQDGSTLFISYANTNNTFETNAPYVVAMYNTNSFLTHSGGFEIFGEQLESVATFDGFPCTLSYSGDLLHCYPSHSTPTMLYDSSSKRAAYPLGFVNPGVEYDVKSFFWCSAFIGKNGNKLVVVDLTSLNATVSFEPSVLIFDTRPSISPQLASITPVSLPAHMLHSIKGKMVLEIGANSIRLLAPSEISPITSPWSVKTQISISDSGSIIGAPALCSSDDMIAVISQNMEDRRLLFLSLYQLSDDATPTLSPLVVYSFQSPAAAVFDATSSLGSIKLGSLGCSEEYIDDSLPTRLIAVSIVVFRVDGAYASESHIFNVTQQHLPNGTPTYSINFSTVQLQSPIFASFPPIQSAPMHLQTSQSPIFLPTHKKILLQLFHQNTSWSQFTHSGASLAEFTLDEESGWEYSKEFAIDSVVLQSKVIEVQSNVSITFVCLIAKNDTNVPNYVELWLTMFEWDGNSLDSISSVRVSSEPVDPTTLHLYRMDAFDDRLVVSGPSYTYIWEMLSPEELTLLGTIPHRPLTPADVRRDVGIVKLPAPQSASAKKRVNSPNEMYAVITGEAFGSAFEVYTECGNGYVLSQSGFCSRCSPGTLGYGCEVCPAGRICDSFGAVTPSGVCPAGYYCAEGTSTFNTNNTLMGASLLAKKPELCPGGYYCPIGTADPSSSYGTVPQACASGYFCAPGSTVPTAQKCPVNSTSNPLASSIDDCICIEGFFGSAGQCTECLENGVCNSSQMIIPAYFYPMPRPELATHLGDCYSFGCNPNGEGLCSYSCSGSCFITCDSSSLCLTGYEGMLCTRCSEGYFIEYGRCEQCTNTPEWVVYYVFILMALALILGLLYWFTWSALVVLCAVIPVWALTNQPHWVNELMFLLSMFLMLHYGIENHRKDARVPSYQGIIASTILYWQLSSNFAEVLRFNWMRIFSALQNLYSASAINLWGLECNFPSFGFESRYAYQMLWLPTLIIFTALVMGALAFVMRFACSRRNNRRFSRWWRNKYRACRRQVERCSVSLANVAGEDISRPETRSTYQPLPPRRYRDRLTTTILFLFDYAYFPLCIAIFRIFTCVPDAPGAEQSHLRDIPYITCSSVTYNTMFYGSIVAAVFYPAGIALIFLILILGTYRKVQMGNLKIKEGFLTYITAPYKRKYCWWHTVLIIRKLGIALSIAFLDPRSLAFIVTVEGILIGTLTLTTLLNPYKNRAELFYEAVSVLVVLITVLCGQINSILLRPSVAGQQLTSTEIAVFSLNVAFLLGILIPLLVLMRLKWVYIASHRCWHSCQKGKKRWHVISTVSVSHERKDYKLPPANEADEASDEDIELEVAIEETKRLEEEQKRIRMETLRENRRKRRNERMMQKIQKKSKKKQPRTTLDRLMEEHKAKVAKEGTTTPSTQPKRPANPASERSKLRAGDLESSTDSQTQVQVQVDPVALDAPLDLEDTVSEELVVYRNHSHIEHEELRSADTDYYSYTNDESESDDGQDYEDEGGIATAGEIANALEVDARASYEKSADSDRQSKEIPVRYISRLSSPPLSQSSSSSSRFFSTPLAISRWSRSRHSLMATDELDDEQ